MTHKLCRPPKDAVNVERYAPRTKNKWIKDDGQPGLAFSYQRGGTPYGGATACGCYGSTCHKSKAMRRTCDRWYAANGVDLKPVADKRKKKGVTR